MAATHDPSRASPKWLSVTGHQLDLDRVLSSKGQCAAVESYEKLNRIGEGTYGVVYRAKDPEAGKIVAVKQVRVPDEERHNGIPITILREISILRSLRHGNIVNVLDVAVGDDLMGEVFMIMEYVEQDLASMMDDLHIRFLFGEAKCLFQQLLEGIGYLHENDIIHRDVKLQNILLTANGTLKLADFGMARPYNQRPLTPGVVTIWYRAPEVLLGTKYYTPSIDLWSAGCVLAELLQGAPCLTGETPIEQLSHIMGLLGSPTPDDLIALSQMGCPELITWRRDDFAHDRADNVERWFLDGTSVETVDVLRGLLKWDPYARWTAAEALGIGRSRCAEVAGRWWEQSPRAVKKELLPTFHEIRNQSGSASFREQDQGVAGQAPGAANEQEYAFDFGDRSIDRSLAKRPRAM